MSVDIVVEGGTVVNAAGVAAATVVIDNGRIQALLDPAQRPPEHGHAVDATGKLVIPGGVDPHCHIGQKLGDYAGLDNHQQATLAALAGGTTTVVDFAIPVPGQTPWQAVEERRRLADDARCDIATHGCVTDWDDTTAEQIAAMVDVGVRTIKLFTTYRSTVMADPDTVLHVLRELKAHGGIGYVHAEADHLIDDAQRRAAQADAVDAGHHPGTRPEGAELAAVEQVLATARQVDAAVYFVHQSIPAAVDAVRTARRRGIAAYTETCPHYLTLDESVYSGRHPERYAIASADRRPRRDDPARRYSRPHHEGSARAPPRPLADYGADVTSTFWPRPVARVAAGPTGYRGPGACRRCRTRGADHRAPQCRRGAGPAAPP